MENSNLGELRIRLPRGVTIKRKQDGYPNKIKGYPEKIEINRITNKP